MSLTRVGTAALLASASLAVASVILRDLLVEALLLVLLLALSADVAWVWLVVRHPLARFSIVTEGGGELKRLIYPGGEAVDRVRFSKNVEGGVRFVGGPGFLRVRPSRVARRARAATLDLRFKSPYAGEYRIDSLGIELTGPLGLAASTTSVPVTALYSVYPRLASVAAATVKLLGRGGIGETPIELPGAGTEYYEMREYHPGDDFRNVNWKATARENELIVNEHMKEVGTSFLLMLDATAHGFSDADRLATTFLSIANSLALADVRFAVLVHESGAVVAESRGDDPRTSLAVALRAALRVTKLEEGPEFPELEPVRAAMKGLGIAVQPGPLAEMRRFRRDEERSRFEAERAWLRALELSKEGSVQSIVCVTGLFGHAEPLMELAWQARHYGAVTVAVANPCRPWAGVEDEAEAARLIAARGRLSRALRAAGVSSYEGEPLAIAKAMV